MNSPTARDEAESIGDIDIAGRELEESWPNFAEFSFTKAMAPS